MSKRGPKIRSLIIFEIRTWSRAPRREPTLRWRISLFLFKSASPKKKFSTAGSDAAVGNLVFSIKKRFPEKHNVFHGRIRRCDGKSRFFYLKAFPRKKKQRFPRQDPTLDFTNPTVVQLYYTSPRGYSWSAWSYKPCVQVLESPDVCLPSGISWSAWLHKPDQLFNCITVFLEESAGTLDFTNPMFNF